MFDFSVTSLQILILNEKVKNAAYVTGEHLEGLLSCVLSLNIVYKTKKTKKIEKLGTFFETNVYFHSEINRNIFFPLRKFPLRTLVTMHFLIPLNF